MQSKILKAFDQSEVSSVWSASMLTNLLYYYTRWLVQILSIIMWWSIASISQASLQCWRSQGPKTSHFTRALKYTYNKNKNNKKKKKLLKGLPIQCVLSHRHKTGVSFLTATTFLYCHEFALTMGISNSAAESKWLIQSSTIRRSACWQHLSYFFHWLLWSCALGMAAKSTYSTASNLPLWSSEIKLQGLINFLIEPLLIEKYALVTTNSLSFPLHCSSTLSYYPYLLFPTLSGCTEW